jgi:hypothetical protein
MDFPLIYCNGDSYSDENYHSTLLGKVYANVVAEYCNGFVINKSISGSCNRRIIRTTIHDIIQQRKLNPTQQIIVLLGLTFESRSELWFDQINQNNLPEESNFITHSFSMQSEWRENLLSSIDIKTPNRYNLNEKFLKKFSDGRAFFFSPYAERINLLTDLVMLQALFNKLNIDFLIFQSPKIETLESDYLLDFLKQQIGDDERFINFEIFSFNEWSRAQQFTPLDFLDYPEIGHYGSDAHKAFAEQILIPKLQQLKIL